MATNSPDAPMAAVGSYDSVLPFQAIGIETVVLTSENQAGVAQLISRFARDGYAVVFLEESVYAAFHADMDQINETTMTSVIPVPNHAGSLGVGVSSIRKSAERAVGMDIFNVH